VIPCMMISGGNRFDTVTGNAAHRLYFIIHPVSQLNALYMNIQNLEYSLCLANVHVSNYFQFVRITSKLTFQLLNFEVRHSEKVSSNFQI
jgi:hypothetical protein